LHKSSAELRQRFGLLSVPPLAQRFNISPTQQVATVRPAGQGRELALLRWGLVPSWADDLSIGYKLINARAETVADKPSFRLALRSRRCLVLADGFFEWAKAGGKKQPYYFRLREGKPFAFAGLWERWTKGGEPVESCTIVTTGANELVRPVHERMPVILPPESYGAWLDPEVQDRERLLPLLRPYPTEGMVAGPVSTRVNSPRNDDPGCIEPAA
jgi:putative SOS response-associated peptidase YedK